jgi:hypothetical protein
LLAPANLGALLVIAGMWQVLFFITWNGWPFSRVKNVPGRLLSGNAVVIASAVLTSLAADAAGSQRCR